MDDKQSNMAAVPPYEPHPGAAPGPMPYAQHQQAQGQPIMTPQSTGATQPPYGSPPPGMDQPYGGPPAGTPPVAGAPPYQSNPQSPIQQAPPHAHQQQQQPLGEKHEYVPPGQGGTPLFGHGGSPPPQQGQYGSPPPQHPQGQYFPPQHPGTGSFPPPHPMQHQTSMYQTAIPLASLTSAAAPVDCPVCKVRGLTRTEAESGNTTHAWAAVACAVFCLGCIPYLLNNLKDVKHYCSHCGTRLATWHNSGRTVVEAHA